ncbi:hypothetical protein Dvar_39840 [Desulfosarcina variabilis str. Montpellier]|uniref:hypothetical protein n=1 Tax=Desulfosarcina variabilis TaxID=2300 RepID=UPI003AFA346E
MGYTIVKLPPAEERLFDGDDALFKRLAANAHCYGEYGAGQSTRWMAKHTHAKIHSVETNEQWARSVALECGQPDRVNVRYCDVGPVEQWGRPVGYTHRDGFRTYIHAWWDAGEKPDLVLVDGRFRVACFLKTLKEAEYGTFILFDDYMKRPHYHLVEEFIPPVEKCGRQVLFVKTAEVELDIEKIDWMLERFIFVMD